MCRPSYNNLWTWLKPTFGKSTFTDEEGKSEKGTTFSGCDRFLLTFSGILKNPTKS